MDERQRSGFPVSPEISGCRGHTGKTGDDRDVTRQKTAIGRDFGHFVEIGCGNEQLFFMWK
jgi:hypothetical protein